MDREVLYLEDFAHLLNGRSGHIKTFCPFCHEQRSNKRDKSLSIDTQSLAYKCHYCDASGYLKSRLSETLASIKKDFRPMKKDYKLPQKQPNIQSKFEPPFLEFFTNRGINEGTLLDAKVTKETEFMPQDNAKRGVIAFNYFLNGELVNVKYRTRDKHFKFVSGARVIPYNIDSISDEAFVGEEERKCIITEGEIDSLTYIECGYKHVISVPAGANTNLEWIDDFVESHFDKLSVIYISVDNDSKGTEAKNELIRRFGAEMCKVVEYPKPCKDINEVLVQYGREKVKECITNAVDVKINGIQGVYDIEGALDDLFHNGLSKGAMINEKQTDEILSFNTGMLTVVTGVPTSGKTYWLNYILIRLNIIHDWKVAFFSPEFYPVTLHVSQIMETLGGSRFNAKNYSPQHYELLKEYVSKNFFWIDPNDTDINSVLDRGKYLIRKKGIKAFVIDPFNALTDKERKAQKQDEYISDFLQKIRWFARKYNVAMFIVMHPVKQQKLDSGLYPVCDLYSCKGASEIYDKADIGITVWRNEQENYGEMHVTKMKFRHLGDKGHSTFRFNMSNGRYVEVDTDTKGIPLLPFNETTWDNTNYVITKLAPTEQRIDFEELKRQNDNAMKAKLPDGLMSGDWNYRDKPITEQELLTQTEAPF